MPAKTAAEEELTNLQSLPAEIIQEIVEQLSWKEALAFLSSHKDWYTNDALRAVVKKIYIESIQIVVGTQHTLMLDPLGRLWGCGGNFAGQLGLGHNEPGVNQLTQIQLPAAFVDDPIQQVIAGGAHTLVLTKAGQLWGCGWNDSGQLGLGHNNIVHQFVIICIRPLIL